MADGKVYGSAVLVPHPSAVAGMASGSDRLGAGRCWFGLGGTNSRVALTVATRTGGDAR